jgi:hypothetical protein
MMRRKAGRRREQWLAQPQEVVQAAGRQTDAVGGEDEANEPGIPIPLAAR